jgi:hypothetical protein
MAVAPGRQRQGIGSGLDARNLPPDPEIRGEVFMAVPLRAYDPALRGQVTFPPAFVT